MSSEVAVPTWLHIDVPVMIAAINLIDKHRGGVRIAEIAESTGLDEDSVFTSVLASINGGFLMGGAGRIKHGYGPQQAMLVTGATRDARRAVGQWPDPHAAAAQLMADLIAAVENIDDDQTPAVLKYLKAHHLTLVAGAVPFVTPLLGG